jgi:hypothetical protein
MITKRVPWVIFAHAGLPTHQVNFEPARPVCVIHALGLNAWNAAVFMPVFLVPAAGRVKAARGPVTRTLVASWTTVGARPDTATG